LLGLFAIPATSQPKTSTTPKPILVLREGLDGAINEWSGPAKFVLYDDGTVITETSDETAELGGELKYYRATLTPTQADHLIGSLGVKKAMSSSKPQYGQGAGPQHEGVSWRLIYWAANSKTQITIVGSLDEAPAKIVKLVKALENYPRSGNRYLDFNYIITFENSEPQQSVPWPSEWKFVRFEPAMLAGEHVEGVYEYHMVAAHALELAEKMAKAKTKCVSVNGHAWRVSLTPDPHLPSDSMWAH
jgi:hypothetical protein